MKRGHIAAVVTEANHSAPGPAATANSAVLAARTIADVDIEVARRAAADFLSALGIDVDREDLRENPGPDGPRLRGAVQHAAAGSGPAERRAAAGSSPRSGPVAVVRRAARIRRPAPLG